MANEGQFPKLDGDILFASEVNKFEPKIIANVIQLVTAGSVIDFVDHGASATYSGTVAATQISDFMVIEYQANISSSATTSAQRAARIRISGAGLNNMVVTSKNFTTNATTYINHNFRHVLTSGAITASGGNIGSDYIFQPQYRSAAGDNYAQDILIWGH